MVSIHINLTILPENMRFVKGFRIIDVPLGEGIDGFHHLYIKEHSGSKVNKESNGKVLFVGNVEYRINMTDTTIDEYLRLLFSRFGDVENVYVSVMPEESTVTSRTAHVEFSKKSSMKLALNASESDYTHACKEVCENFGVVIRKKSAADIKRAFPREPFEERLDRFIKRQLDRHPSRIGDMIECIKTKGYRIVTERLE